MGSTQGCRKVEFNFIELENAMLRAFPVYCHIYGEEPHGTNTQLDRLTVLLFNELLEAEDD